LIECYDLFLTQLQFFLEGYRVGIAEPLVTYNVCPNMSLLEKVKLFGIERTILFISGLSSLCNQRKWWIGYIVSC
jgi:hypothetical protein